MGTPSGSFAARLLEHVERSVSVEEWRLAVLTELRSRVSWNAGVFWPGVHIGGFRGDCAPGEASPVLLDHDEAEALRWREAAGYPVELRALYLALERDSVVRMSDVYSTRARRALAFCADPKCSGGYAGQLACALVFQGRLRGVIVLVRSGDRRDFAERERRSVLRMMPLLALADAAARSRFDAAPLPDRPVVDPRLARFRSEFELLAPRAQEVARLLGRGLATKEIARLLGTSPSTVHKQTLQIFARLQTDGRTEVAILMQLAGLAGAETPL